MDCKKKWKNIRDTYRKVRNKEKQDSGLASMGGPSKYSDGRLHFLEKASDVPETSTTVDEFKPTIQGPSFSEICFDNSSSQLEESLEEEEEVEDINSKTKATEDFNSKRKATDDINSKRKATDDINSKRKATEDINSKRRKTTEDINEELASPACKKKDGVSFEEEFMQEFLKERQERIDIFKNTQLQSLETPNETFFKSMAGIVNTFPVNLAIEARMKVHTVISELELKAIEVSESTGLE